MPRIPEYRSRVGVTADIPARAAQPSDLGGTGLSELGQGIQQGGARFAEAKRFLNARQAANEVTQTDVKMLQAQAELTNELETMARTWKPEDGEIVPAMQEKVRQRMEGIAFTGDGTAVHETPEGRRHFEQKAAQLSAHFLTHTAQVQSHLLGQQVIVEHKKAVDIAANTAQANPEAFDVFQQQVTEMIDNPNGRYAALPSSKRQELKQAALGDIARATAQGKIRAEPRVALDRLTNGWLSEHLADTDTPQLISQAKTAVHALEIDEDRAYREQERQRVATARAISNKMLTKLAAHDADPKNPPLTAQDLIDSGLGQYDDNGFQSLISVLHTRSKEGEKEVKTDPAVFRRLFNRIHADPGDPARLKDEIAIQDAFGKKQQLSYADMTHLRKEFQDARTPDGARLSDTKRLFLDRIQTQITKSNMLMGKIDTDGDKQMLLYTLEVNRRVEEARKNGEDPHELFNPKSPKFVGSAENLAPYQKSMKESMKSFSDKMRRGSDKLPALPPEQMRKEGESYSDWKKRVNP